MGVFAERYDRHRPSVHQHLEGKRPDWRLRVLPPIWPLRQRDQGILAHLDSPMSSDENMLDGMSVHISNLDQSAMLLPGKHSFRNSMLACFSLPMV